MNSPAPQSKRSQQRRKPGKKVKPGQKMIPILENMDPKTYRKFRNR
jgi:hypothetical protein